MLVAVLAEAVPAHLARGSHRAGGRHGRGELGRVLGARLLGDLLESLRVHRLGLSGGAPRPNAAGPSPESLRALSGLLEGELGAVRLDRPAGAQQHRRADGADDARPAPTISALCRPST